MCFCESGYQVQSDGSCIDVNECLNTSTCDHNCTNEIGSFTCSCTVGYRLGNDGKRCTVCNPGFYGENCETQCRCGRGSKECDNTKGCVCGPGWRGETCDDDINECDSSPCTGEHEVCLNTPGSFRCDCLQGFKNSSGTCEDIDECQEPHICHQLCTNTNGSYTCGCKVGYELINSKDCVDIDECAKARCSKCSNWPGSFKCSCSDGYRLNATTLRDCENVDECQENTHICSLNATCIDTDGSFNCSCHKGTQGDGYNCAVCSSFTYGDQCSEKCKCDKNNSDTCDAVIGSCHCRTGWNGSDCSQDVDECKEGIRTCNTTLHQLCVNDPGSSHCECLYGGNNLTSCNRPQPPIHINATDVKVKAEIKFGVNVTREDFLQNSTNWRCEIEKTLKEFHRDVPGFSTLLVLSIRLGSLLVDYEIIGVKAQSKKIKFEVGVANSMLKILKGEHTFKILKQEARVIEVIIKDNNGSSFNFTTPPSPCNLLKAFYECPFGYHCDDSSNEAECVFDDSSDLVIITISVGVGVPVLIAAIVIIILWKRYQKKARKLKEKSDHDEKLHVMLAGKIPRPKHSPSSEYDFIDSQSMYNSRYIDMGRMNPNFSADFHKDRRFGADDEFPVKRPNLDPGMYRAY